MNHIADAGKMVETIEVSKLLSECADWLMQHREFAASHDQEKNLEKWAAVLRSIVIPSPGAPDEKEA